MALLVEVLRLTITCRPSTTWRSPSKLSGVLAPVTVAVDETTSRLPSLQTPWVLALRRDNPPWANQQPLGATTGQEVMTTAPTGHVTIVVVIGAGAATAVVAESTVTAAVPMIAHIPPLLPLLSLRGRTLCSSWD